MRKWKELYEQLQLIEAQIAIEVLQLQRSQELDNVRVTYAKGRTSYDYQAIAEELNAPDEMIQQHLKMTVDYKKVVERLAPAQEVMKKHAKVTDPKVTIKLIDKTNQNQYVDNNNLTKELSI
jgi:hypothetical protein